MTSLYKSGQVLRTAAGLESPLTADSESAESRGRATRDSTNRPNAISAPRDSTNPASGSDSSIDRKLPQQGPCTLRNSSRIQACAPEQTPSSPDRVDQAVDAHTARAAPHPHPPSKEGSLVYRGILCLGTKTPGRWPSKGFPLPGAHWAQGSWKTKTQVKGGGERRGGG